VDLGCDWIETDLRLTSDGIPVLLHDTTLDRTTNGKGKVASTTLAHVLRLDAGGWYSRQFRGERIPTLEEALEWARHRCGLNLEIKEEDRIDELIHRLARRFSGPAALDRVLLSSFRSSDLQQLRAALPQARLGWLVSRSSRGLTAA